MRNKEEKEVNGIKLLTKREFDKRYQNMKEWPMETLYVFYLDLMSEVIDKLRKKDDSGKDKIPKYS
jgi:hypothetical protein